MNMCLNMRQSGISSEIEKQTNEQINKQMIQ